MRGIATSTTGARELEKATGIQSQTVAAFLTERDERVRMLQGELRRLEVDFAHTPGTIPAVKRVSKRDLDMDARGFSPGRYVFDSKSGEVMKSETGAWHPLNTLGVKLQDAGQTRKSDGASRLQEAEKFSDRFRAQTARGVGSLQETLGRSLASYEVVALDEAKAARSEHRAQNVEERERLRSYLTKTAQVENLLATGNAEGKRFLLVMDESSMTGAKDSARIAEIAKDMGARVVLQGDTKQHGSVSAGRAFLQTQKGGINLSTIEETRRFDNATAQQKQAIAEMKQGRFAEELLRVVSYDLNNNRLVLQRENGKTVELDPSKHTKFSLARMETRAYAAGDAVEARANIGRLKDPERVANGARGTIVAVSEEGARVRWQDGKEMQMSNKQMRYVDHAYAHTSHKEQGVTNHREIFLVSDTGAHWLNREASYVAASRAKQNTEIVTTEKAYDKMLENAGKETEKTTAIDIQKNLSLDRVQARDVDLAPAPERRQERSAPELGL